MIKLVYTIYCWFAVIVGFISFTCTGLVTWPFFKDKQQGYYNLAKKFIRLLFFFTNIKVDTIGIENIPDTNVIVVSNHQSLLDIFFLMAFFPKQITFFAKKELKYVPILGFNLVQMGHVLVDRGKGKKALTQLNMIKSKLLDGKSIIIFPEGTRSSDGQIASFKKGAFVLSNQTSKPLIPCLISGTGKTLPKNKFWITNTKIKLHILPEVRVMVKEKDNKTLVDLYKTTTRNILLETQKKLDLI